MSLYHKYRPKSFTTVVGNAAVVDSIQSLLSGKKPPHSYMLCGPTGCGKTTIARIIAKELQCVGKDYREINSANFRGIDTARDIIQQSQFMPLEGKCRIWMIDECHKLTNDAQNALLKILEDTPAHVYFILATTEPEKLIPAIRGRCSIFQLSTLSDTEMKKLLRKVATKEGEEIEEEVYEQIIQDAFGHPRNALQVLEQVLSVSPENRLEIAKKKAGEYNECIHLCQGLLKGESWKSIASILRGLKGQDAETIRRAVCGYASAVLLNGASNDKAGLILEEFKEPFFNSGFPGLVYACYSVVSN